MADLIAATTTAVATVLTGAPTSDPELQSAEVVVEDDVKATPAAETDKKTDTTNKEEAKKDDTNKEEVKKVETTANDNQKVETKTDDNQKVDTAPVTTTVTTTVTKTADTQEPTPTGPIAAEKPPVVVQAKEAPVETIKAAEGDKPTGDKPETKVDKPTEDKPEIKKTPDVTESSSVVPDTKDKPAVEESTTTTTTTTKPLETEETTSKPDETTPPPPPPPETKDTPTVEVTSAADDKALPETPEDVREVPATSGEGTSAPSAGEEKTDKEDAAKVERKSKWKSFVKRFKSIFAEKA